MADDHSPVADTAPMSALDAENQTKDPQAEAAAIADGSHGCYKSSDNWVEEFPPDVLEKYEVQNPESIGWPWQNPFPTVNLKVWQPENQLFWLGEGEGIALKNLLVSIPNLTLGFAVWLAWSVIASKIQLAHDKSLEDGDEVYPFGLTHTGNTTVSSKDYKSQVGMLPAVAGLCGATMRIAHSFMVTLCGGRNVKFVSTWFALIPMIIGGVELMKKDASLVVLSAAAGLSGIGGGCFASSMNNISFYFPKKKQGFGLGLNAGVGNFGVSLTQLVIPLLMGYAAFGGSDTYGGQQIYNGCWFYVPLLSVVGVFALLWMNNLPSHEGNTAKGLLTFAWLQLTAVASSTIGVTVMFVTKDDAQFKSSAGKIGRAWFLMAIVLVVQHLAMLFTSPRVVQKKIKSPEIMEKVWKDKHTYIMTWLYVMCFGSFIGFSAAFPKLILDLFGYYKSGGKNPDAPEPTTWAWIGAFVGSAIRPVGGWLSDKFSGAAVTAWCTLSSTILAIIAGILIMKAGEQEDRMPYFGGTFVVFILLFTCTGLMNGSTFQQIGVLWCRDPVPRGMVLGWSSAIASYGAFIIPAMFGSAIGVDKGENVCFALAAYYCTCLFLNFWYYQRPGAECPDCRRQYPDDVEGKENAVGQVVGGAMSPMFSPGKAAQEVPVTASRLTAKSDTDQ